jgi:HAD superfamily hydrolase (TIGR01509 family)
MIKAIFFDSGNVLAKEGFTPGIAEYEKTHNIPKGKLYASAHERNFWKEFTLGQITEKEYFSKLNKDFGQPLDIGQLQQTIYKNFKINWELLKFIKTLKGKYILGVVSNNPKEWFDFLWHEGGWGQLFTVKAVSSEQHIRKPDVKIYEYALKQASVNCNETVYVDDRQDRIQGAENLGMRFIIFKNVKQLRQDLTLLSKGNL